MEVKHEYSVIIVACIFPLNYDILQVWIIWEILSASFNLLKIKTLQTATWKEGAEP